SGPNEVTDRGFTGQKENMADLGLYARWYSPLVGRFLSADTLVPDPANPQSCNRYSYSFNNPINYTDPDGHDPHWCNGDAACMRSYGYTSAPRTNAAYQVHMMDTTYGNDLDLYDEHPWAATFYQHIASGELSVPEGMSTEEYVNQLVYQDLMTAIEYDGAGAMGELGATSLTVMTLGYEALWYTAPGDYGSIFAHNYAHAPGDALDENTIIYRGGGTNPGNLTPRPQDKGMLSFRDSLSNPYPLAEGQRPVLEPGKGYFGVHTSHLSPGSVIFDNVPPGHVSVYNVPPEVMQEAIRLTGIRGKFPR
ncbi:MAG: hypothetical protein KC415_04210, partial [Anaerolineales bacterium]|nr:hypothetical protein [Anaerolineales bacterium]